MIVNVVSACGKRGERRARTRREGRERISRRREDGEARARITKGIRGAESEDDEARASETRARIRSGDVHARTDPEADTRMSALAAGRGELGREEAGAVSCDRVIADRSFQHGGMMKGERGRERREREEEWNEKRRKRKTSRRARCRTKEVWRGCEDEEES